MLDDVSLAGQPTREDFKLFQERGVKSVINLRAKEELNWDEAGALREFRLEYHHIPVANPAALTDEAFDKVRKILNDSEQRPLLVHCTSANRVGTVWLAHRVLDGGLTYEAALAEAKKVGLTVPALEAKAREYIAKQAANKADDKPK